MNIRASDYRFNDKASFYKGFINKRGQKKEGTKVIELVNMANTKTDFTESDIEERNSLIIESFLEFIKINGLEK